MSAHVIRRLGAELEADFLALHSESCGHGWCRCTAWWVAGWEGWGERSAEQNLLLRRGLFQRGVSDGYLLYDGDDPVAWCQCAPRDSLPGLAHDFELEEDAGTWAVSCFFVAAGHRRLGHARRLLEHVLVDLVERGARRVEAYPRIDATGSDGEQWTGPKALFLDHGFREVDRNERRLVLVRELG